MRQTDWIFLESVLHWLAAWSVVIVAVALWIYCARVRRSALRYTGWVLATFAGLLLIPVVGLVGPATSWQNVTALFQAPTMKQAAAPLQFEPWFQPQPGDVQTIPQQSVQLAKTTSTESSPQATTDAVLASSGPTQRTIGRHDSRGWIWWMAVVWVSGTALGLLRLAVQVLRVRRLFDMANVPVPPSLAARFELAVSEIQIKRRVRLLVHPKLPSPVCTGLFRACVIWPANNQGLMQPEQQHDALVHELSHLKRYDDVVCLAAELWRCCCWFYPPVHWTIAQLRHEQEFLCDDVAASRSKRPERYARLLLDLTPIRTMSGNLSAPFVGDGNIVSRVRRIIAGETRQRPPLKSATVAVLFTCALLLLCGGGTLRLIGFIERATAAEPTDGPLPEITAQALGERLKEAWPVYDRCRYEATFERDLNLQVLGPAKPGAPKRIQSPGRFRYASDGRRWRADYDSKNYGFTRQALAPNRWSAGFDGEVHYLQKGEFVTLGEEETHDFGPRHLFMSSWGKSLPDLLQKNDWTFKPQHVVDGYRCYVLERESKPRSKTELIISPQQSYLPVSIRVSYNGKLSWSNQLLDLQKTGSGLWYPRRVKHHASYADRESALTRFEVPGAFADDYFIFEIPHHARVQDYRAGINYRNDPWWPEMSKIIKEHHGWPPDDLVPLKDVSSRVPPEKEGKAAPPLTVAQWINGRPAQLAERRGKVTLLLFSSGSLISPAPRWISSLRGLYELYQPLGLEVIEINAATTDGERLKQRVRELRIPWPVAVDQASEKSRNGSTFEAYGLQTYLSMLLVDAQGRMRLIKPGELINDLNRLLDADTAAGDPPQVTFDFINMPREVYRTATREWRNLVPKSPAKGTILGKITDGDGRPLPNVLVKAALKFHLSSSIHSASATFVAPYRAKKFEARTAADGTYELSGLWKGTYDLSTSLNGKAVLERTASVGPKFEPVDVDLVLTQNDGLSGRILDETGQPIKGAKITILHRHHNPESLESYTTYRVKPKVTDADGRFLFDGLHTGAYTFEIVAKGYARMELKQIPVGESLGDLRLVRADP